MQSFLWVVGDLIVPGYAISLNLPLSDLAVVFTTPRVELLDVADYGVTNPSNFKHFLWNSLTVAIPTVILAMCLVVPAAYALSRREFIFRRKILFGYILLTQVGGGLGIALLIGLYAIYVQFGLNDSKLALAVYYAATAVPFNTWLLKTYMDGIPVSYEEAAVVDGAPPWRVVTEVVLPLSTAGLATVFVFTFLTGWTEFVVAQTRYWGRRTTRSPWDCTHSSTSTRSLGAVLRVRVDVRDPNHARLPVRAALHRGRPLLRRHRRIGTREVIFPLSFDNVFRGGARAEG